VFLSRGLGTCVASDNFSTVCSGVSLTGRPRSAMSRQDGIQSGGARRPGPPFPGPLPSHTPVLPHPVLPARPVHRAGRSPIPTRQTRALPRSGHPGPASKVMPSTGAGPSS
jgi:hypothetical protein